MMKHGATRARGAAAVLALVVAAGGVEAQEPDREVEIVTRPEIRLSTLGGTGGWLGVSILDVDDERASEAGLDEEYGVYVASVSEDGPAEAAGLMEGDVLVGWNGERLESAAQLQRLVRETPAGRTVTLDVVRDGGRREVDVELGDRADAANRMRVFTVPRQRVRIDPDRADELRERIRSNILVEPREGITLRALAGRPRLGVSIQGLGDQLADYFGVESGVLVTAVSEDSPAEAAGIRAGDVIVGVAGESVENRADLLEALSEREAGPVEIEVVRDGQARTLTAELEEGSGGVFRFRDDAWEFRDGEGAMLDLEPFLREGLEVGPFEFRGLDFEPMRWRYRLPRDLRIRIPDVQAPNVEIAPIEVPEIDVVMPRRVQRVATG